MFLEQIREVVSLDTYNLLNEVGVGNYEEINGLLIQFPSIARDPGINLPSLSNLVAAHVSSGIMSAIRSKAQNPPRFARGSFNPPRSLIGNGYQQPSPSAPPVAIGVPSNPIVQTLTTPVRNQGQRGTCVAHAVVACVEEYFSHHDLSEQFKYWASKKHGGDPFPNEEGTWLRCAKNALGSHGVCDESLWRYNPIPMSSDETQEIIGTAPSTLAIQDAVIRQISAATYRDTSGMNNGKASLLVQELNKGPVAVSLPCLC